MKPIALAMLALFVLVAAPAGIERANAAATGAPPGLDQLDVFLGNWSCNGKAYASSTVPTPVTSGQIHAETAVDGQWIDMRYDETATATNQDPFHVAQYLGYDPVTQKFLLVSVDNFLAHNTETSTGWKGNTITFEGTTVSDGRNAGIRETYTVLNPNEMTHSAAARGANGQWITTDEETCRKIP
ncbi:MAG TPA: DUF1579 family protein [Rhodanobacteraceae bacterium]|nr:DUF1579 family protein [Rhodanobacteraceae bacterium]